MAHSTVLTVKQAGVVSKGTTLYKHGEGLPMDVIKHVTPVFEELSDDKLLRKCLHGKSQNQNESYNSTIWHRIPKSIFVSATTFHLGVYDAAAHYKTWLLYYIRMLRTQ